MRFNWYYVWDAYILVKIRRILNDKIIHLEAIFEMLYMKQFHFLWKCLCLSYGVISSIYFLNFLGGKPRCFSSNTLSSWKYHQQSYLRVRLIFEFIFWSLFGDLSDQSDFTQMLKFRLDIISKDFQKNNSVFLCFSSRKTHSRYFFSWPQRLTSFLPLEMIAAGCFEAEQQLFDEL